MIHAVLQLFPGAEEVQYDFGVVLGLHEDGQVVQRHDQVVHVTRLPLLGPVEFFSYDLQQFAHLEKVVGLHALELLLQEFLFVDAGLAQHPRVHLLLPALERVLLRELGLLLAVDQHDSTLDVLVLLVLVCQLGRHAEQVGLEKLENDVLQALLEDTFYHHEVGHEHAFVRVGDQDPLEH